MDHSPNVDEVPKAATVVLLRDFDDGPRALLLRRSRRLSFHGGAWVFPGGRIDAEDHAAATGDDLQIGAARQAAVREAREECGLIVNVRDLRLISRWITPEGAPRRFDTFFFAALAPAGEVQVDGGEIREHRWMSPIDALAARERGEIDLPPPTFVTILHMSAAAQRRERATAPRRERPTAQRRERPGIETAQDLARRLTAIPYCEFRPHRHFVDDGVCTLYPGDVAYDDGVLDRPGPRHRLWHNGELWRYERDPTG